MTPEKVLVTPEKVLVSTGKTATVFILAHSFYEGGGWENGPLPPTALQKPVFG